MNYIKKCVFSICNNVKLKQRITKSCSGMTRQEFRKQKQNKTEMLVKNSLILVVLKIFNVVEKLRSKLDFY